MLPWKTKEEVIAREKEVLKELLMRRRARNAKLESEAEHRKVWGLEGE